MTTHDTAIAASLDVSQVQQLSQLSEEAFWDYARKLSGIVPFADVQSTEQKDAVSVASVVSAVYLECMVSEGRCLFPLAALHEAMPLPHRYTFLPNRPLWMLGLVAWRGAALAVVDLSLYLMDDTRDTRDTSDIDQIHEPVSPARLLIAHDGDLSLGLLVHSTGDVVVADDVLPVASDDTLSSDTVSWYVPVRGNIISGSYDGAVVLNVSALLADIVRQLTMATPYG